MTNSGAAPALGPIEHSILRALDRRREPVWRVECGLPTGLSATSVRGALQRLVAAGQVERIERGTYVVMPRSGRVILRPLELVGSWLGDEPHAVIGQAAAEHHHLTLDTPTTVEVQLARAKPPVEFQGVRYVFSRRDPRSVGQDNMRVRHAGASTLVASPAKLLVLLLDATPSRRGTRPPRDVRLALEVVERGAERRLWDRVDWPLVLRRHGSAAAARRLGYLLQRAGIDESDLLPLRGVSGNIPLSPLYPAVGPVDPRWRVVINDPVVR